ncbi:DUF418 domain-containing protein [Algoriphagus aquimarinus]|uniref:DUF418 domain-containing protein n=1 Tax=Algoriphagus aquimarinus TaxID=237018 RepID=A0A5C7AJP8_9BACT|nr:DUF418 domain-containing protein [Algoriphagus aquimarinus]TXE08946.1 DUF418 domain-containing protein [Algoriphagus aquimarinus]
MTESTFQDFKPLKQSDRILSLDVMRGIVLCGILLMNINGYGLYESYSDPTVTGGSTGLNLYTWMTTNMLFEGTMRALFSLLFGVGMFMFLDRLLKKGAGIKAADIYFRRITWLLVFGLIHGYLLLWTGEILYQYALMGFLVYSFRSMAPKFLIATAIILFSIGTLWLYVNYTNTKKWMAELEEVKVFEADGKELTKELKAAKSRWEKYEEKRTPEAVQEYNDEMHKGYFKVVAHLAPENFDSDTLWPYKYDVWDVLSMMLIGMALFKLGVLTGEKPNSFYLAMVGIGYAIGLLINYYEMNMILEDNFSVISQSKSMITYYWGRVFVAMGHVGLIMLFCKSPILGWLKSSIAAVGKMALTNYLMHSVICMIIFTGVGFGMFGKLQRYELLYVVFGIWIFQLILSPIWLRYFHYGPAEWLWRNLSYGKVHGFRKMPAQTI